MLTSILYSVGVRSNHINIQDKGREQSNVVFEAISLKVTSICIIYHTKNIVAFH